MASPTRYSIVRRAVGRLWGHGASMLWLNHLVTIGWAVFLLPAVLRVFSEAETALWLGFSMLGAMGTLADAGFRATAVRAASYFWAGRSDFGSETGHGGAGVNVDGLVKLAATLARTYLALCLVSVVICAGLGGVVLHKLIVQSPAGWLSFGLTVVQILIALWLGRYTALLEGCQEVASVYRQQAIFGVVRIAGGGVAILLGGGLVGFCSVFLLVTVAQTLFFQRRLRLFLRTLSGRGDPMAPTGGFDRVLFARLWAPSWRMGLIQVGGFFILQGTSMAAAQLDDPGEVASYLLTLRLISIIMTFARVPVNAIIPKLNVQRAAGDLAGYRRAFAGAIALQMSLVVLLLVVTKTGGDFFLAHAGRSGIGLAEASTYAALAFWAALETHHAAHAQSYMTTNRVPFLVPSLVSGAVIVAASFAVLERGGALGLALVLCVVQLAFNNWYPVALNLRSLSWSLGDYIKAMAVALFAPRRALP